MVSISAVFAEINFIGKLHLSQLLQFQKVKDMRASEQECSCGDSCIFYTLAGWSDEGGMCSLSLLLILIPSLFNSEAN
jgi:hypothetical protein